MKSIILKCVFGRIFLLTGGCGTGVHVGQGLILTCAHVVDALDDDTGANSDSDSDDDDDNDDDGDVDVDVTKKHDATTTLYPCRIGRRKVCMFADGRLFMAECVSQVESASGENDVAVMLLGHEIMIHGADNNASGIGRATSSASTLPASRSKIAVSAALTPAAMLLPAAASVASTACSPGDGLFCVGNPSRMEFEAHAPPTWHTSVGHCQGYLSKADATTTKAKGFNAAGTKRQRNASNRDLSDASSSKRGKARTNSHSSNAISSSSSVQEDEQVEEEDKSYLMHSCWTYWGHSGAPLFSAETGGVSGLHCAWNHKNGMRHGQRLPLLHAALKAATTSSTCTSSQEAVLTKKGMEVDLTTNETKLPTKKHKKTKIWQVN